MSKHGIQVSSTPTSQEILAAFPLARFSNKFMKGLPPPNGDGDWFMSNYSTILQVMHYRVAYSMMICQIPGLDFAFPFSSAAIEKENGETEFVVYWIGYHDPYNLGDGIMFRAKTTWTSASADRRISYGLEWHNDQEMTYAPSGFPKDVLRLITRAIPSDVFEEAFFTFYKALNVFVPCTYETKNKEKDYYEHPETGCPECKDVGWVLLEFKNPKFSPTFWFECFANAEFVHKPRVQEKKAPSVLLPEPVMCQKCSCANHEAKTCGASPESLANDRPEGVPSDCPMLAGM